MVGPQVRSGTGVVGRADDMHAILDAETDATLDVQAGADSSIYAWRRAKVADLNQLARERWAAEGRLRGPEMSAPGGRTYAAGDLIVTLAPGPDGAVVTSEHGTVDAVDPASGAIRLRTADDRLVTLNREATSSEKLDHGYALRVHRSQGDTTENGAPLRRRWGAGAGLRVDVAGRRPQHRLRRRRRPGPGSGRSRPGLVGRAATAMGHRHRDASTPPSSGRQRSVRTATARPGLERGVALGPVAGHQLIDPGTGHPVAPSDLARGSTLDNDSDMTRGLDSYYEDRQPERRMVSAMSLATWCPGCP